MLLTGWLILHGVQCLLRGQLLQLPRQCRWHPATAFIYRNAETSVKEHRKSPVVTEQANKPIVLLWFWPENKLFDFQDCDTLFDINSCHLTDNRSLYSSAQGVLVFHKAIHDNLTNLPTVRGRLQRWVWFNMDTPDNTRRIAGIHNLFNLTLSYRSDADIQVRWRVTLKKNTDDFVLPKKERLVCWIVDSDELHTKSGERDTYYRELKKHINVDIFHSSSAVAKGENYFITIGSCKFYLSFESAIHKDYITETFNGPLAAGTVPIVLGPPRRNYEKFAPATSFIHVHDFPDVASLSQYLLTLDKDNKTYMSFFKWRRFYTARRHPTEERHEFAHAICQACYHLGWYKDYRVMSDVYKWLTQ
uniref:Fucosyltransferase n=1 Tax=Mola mola TaxID=94237 RepID=A0A3Q4BWL3_MOLML